VILVRKRCRSMCNGDTYEAGQERVPFATRPQADCSRRSFVVRGVLPRSVYPHEQVAETEFRKV